MVDNSLASICAARTAGISTNGIKKGIKAFRPVSGRMNIYELSDSIKMIDDTYNANPTSVAGALSTLHDMSRNKKRFAVLGDMLELGKESDALHKQIGKKAAISGINKLYLFGTQVKYTLEGAIENGFAKGNIFHGTKEKIARKVLEDIDSDTWILVKGYKRCYTNFYTHIILITRS